jgi:hypothetical protein
MNEIDIKIAEILANYLIKGESNQTATELKRLFEYEEVLPLDERRKAFADTLRPYVDIYGSPMITEFYKYWGAGKRKLAYEQQKSWHLEMRLSTWCKNNEKFSIANMIKTKGLTI